MDKLILTTIENYVATITLNRPEKHNALSSTMIELLQKILDEINNNPNIRVVILCGNGKSFCAGADLNDIKKDMNPNTLASLFSTLSSLSKPTICKVHGNVYGGGIGLAACCDVVTAKPNTNFCFSEVKHGLAPATIAPYVIAKIGASQAHRYFLSAEIFNEETALKMALIHDVDATDNLVQQFLSNDPHAIAATKQLINRISIDESIKKETEKILENLKSKRSS